MAGASAVHRVTKALDGKIKTVRELTEELGYSEVTIRVTIKELTRDNKLTRTPGFPAHYTLTKDETKLESTIDQNRVDRLIEVFHDKDYVVGRELTETVRRILKEKGHENMELTLLHLLEAVRQDNERRGNAKTSIG